MRLLNKLFLVFIYINDTFFTRTLKTVIELVMTDDNNLFIKNA